MPVTPDILFQASRQAKTQAGSANPPAQTSEPGGKAASFADVYADQAQSKPTALADASLKPGRDKTSDVAGTKDAGDDKSAAEEPVVADGGKSLPAESSVQAGDKVAGDDASDADPAPVVDAALLVLQFALHDRPATHAGRLLRSAFIAGSETEGDRRAMADFRLRDEQRDRWDWFELERWAGVTGCEQLTLAARRLGELIRGLTAAEIMTASSADYIGHCHEMLTPVGSPRARPMYSGPGKYLDNIYVAHEFGERLYLKTHTQTRTQ